MQFWSNFAMQPEDKESAQELIRSRTAKIVLKRCDTGNGNGSDIPRMKMAKRSDISTVTIKTEKVFEEEQCSENFNCPWDSESLLEKIHQEEAIRMESGDRMSDSDYDDCFDEMPEPPEVDETENYIIILDDAFENETDYCEEIPVTSLRKNMIFILDDEQPDAPNGHIKVPQAENKANNMEAEGEFNIDSYLRDHFTYLPVSQENLVNGSSNCEQNQPSSNPPHSVVEGKASKVKNKKPHVLKNHEQNNRFALKVIKREFDLHPHSKVNVSVSKENLNVSSQPPLPVVKIGNDARNNSLSNGNTSKEVISKKSLAVTSSESYSCKLCPYKTSMKTDFIQHESIHKFTSLLPKHSSDFECPYCSAVVYSEYDLTMHIGKHFSERLFTCPYCTLTFRTAQNLKLHLSKHVLSVLIPPRNPNAPAPQETHQMHKSQKQGVL